MRKPTGDCASGPVTMHDSVMAYVRFQVERRRLADLAVVEVGSADVNGSVRSLFSGSYLGLDIVQADGVDLVVKPGDVPVPDESVQVVVCTECLEHDLRPWVTLREIARVLAPGGVLLLTARGLDERGVFQFHNAPDRWRYSVDGLRALVEDVGLEVVDCSPDPQCPGVFATAVK